MLENKFLVNLKYEVNINRLYVSEKFTYCKGIHIIILKIILNIQYCQNVLNLYE